MAVLRDKPYPRINFVVDVGTGETEGPEAGLAEVILPSAQVNTIEYRSGNDKELNAKLIHTLTRYGNLVLKRGVIGSLTWYGWWNAVRNGDSNAARTVTVSLLNEDRSSMVLTWKFLRARPVNYSFSPLNALANEPLLETLELAFERFEME
ncbi:MAG: phage tail protein [Burkholderiales bacterium]